MEKTYVGIDVGGTKLAYGLFDEQNKMIARLERPARPELSAQDGIEEMLLTVNDLFDAAGVGRDSLAGVGAAFPSHIHSESGYIIHTTNLPHWKGMNIRDIMSEKLMTRVEIDNDANAAAIAEHALGAGRGKRHMIYITVSTGIGGGLIIDGKIFRGSYGAAGEVGHALISDSQGSLCGCGNIGCAESLASGPSMEKYMNERVSQGAISALSELSEGKWITTRHLAKAIEMKDALAMETVERAAEYLARLFASLYQILNIDHVVYGGGALKIGSILMQTAQDRFVQMVRHAREYPVCFAPAQLGDDVGIIGASLLVR